MSETVTGEERDEFLRSRFGIVDGLITERHGADWRTMSLAGRPIAAKPTAEYRAAHLALPPGPKRMSPAELDAYFAKQRARIDQLEAGATRLEG
jgi:hypothetical protein